MYKTGLNRVQLGPVFHGGKTLYSYEPAPANIARESQQQLPPYRAAYSPVGYLDPAFASYKERMEYKRRMSFNKEQAAIQAAPAPRRQPCGSYGRDGKWVDWKPKENFFLNLANCAYYPLRRQQAQRPYPLPFRQPVPIATTKSQTSTAAVLPTVRSLSSATASSSVTFSSTIHQQAASSLPTTVTFVALTLTDASSSASPKTTWSVTSSTISDLFEGLSLSGVTVSARPKELPVTPAFADTKTTLVLTTVTVTALASTPTTRTSAASAKDTDVPSYSPADRTSKFYSTTTIAAADEAVPSTAVTTGSSPEPSNAISPAGSSTGFDVLLPRPLSSAAAATSSLFAPGWSFTTVLMTPPESHDATGSSVVDSLVTNISPPDFDQLTSVTSTTVQDLTKTMTWETPRPRAAATPNLLPTTSPSPDASITDAAASDVPLPTESTSSFPIISDGADSVTAVATTFPGLEVNGGSTEVIVHSSSDSRAPAGPTDMSELDSTSSQVPAPTRTLPDPEKTIAVDTSRSRTSPTSSKISSETTYSSSSPTEPSPATVSSAAQLDESTAGGAPIDATGFSSSDSELSDASTVSGTISSGADKLDASTEMTESAPSGQSQVTSQTTAIPNTMFPELTSSSESSPTASVSDETSATETTDLGTTDTPPTVTEVDFISSDPTSSLLEHSVSSESDTEGPTSQPMDGDISTHSTSDGTTAGMTVGTSPVEEQFPSTQMALNTIAGPIWIDSSSLATSTPLSVSSTSIPTDAAD